MIHEWQERTALLVGNEALEKLASSHVIVVGLGGVGAYAAEQLCRAGVGKLTIVDGDKIDTSNRNRQLPALVSTLGKRKAYIVAGRLKDINPDVDLIVIDEFIKDDRMKDILAVRYDYVVDAIDTLSPKVFLVRISLENGLRVVSSMGSGGKLDPEKIRVADISESYNCRLARAMRKRLHRMNINTGFKVVFSPEDVPDSAVLSPDEEMENQKSTVGTISYMPAIFGCMCASIVIRDIIS
ncbi:MAG: tRNA threonylcarbamoyladenosine dehydratase [Lentisphaerae bacterium GWF2_45_14]|nr:MAG: tRNA threonylcarbamoyladenosine dehydratase [Lentisphaerae bacterium GWF2_45_14]